ncbi:hypothetical protein [uncultured Thomasclavelia sp.]|uniref:hypothetical protein n=1 Tax=uncultured Thomasclavelia sp. TaxID=3025759 RepID=UPI002596CE10|nr:hypothetical protein [uncultured Thomasclavelia sp.]
MIDEELLEKVSEITMTDYSECGDLQEQAECIICDLLDELEHYEELLKEVKEHE